MTIEQAMELIHGVAWRGSRPGLARVRELLHRLGDPQDGLQFVHIAGTNGKGSTAAMLASILRAAGYTTGLFTSPYLERFAERMQVNGVPVPDAEFAAVCEALQPCIAAMDDPPTEFELVTAAAMLWFRRRGCDVVVLEVGLGGRLDATNVIAAPACAVITNIGLDHTEILGDTLEQIAREKAGILKPGTRAVSYPQTPEVRAVLHEICAQRGIPLTEADAAAIVPLTDGVDGQTFTYRGFGDLFLLQLLFIRGCFNMCSVDKNHAWVYHPVVQCFVQNMCKNFFTQLRGKAFAKGITYRCKVRNLFQQAISEKPTVCYVYLYIPVRLT